MTQTRPWLGAVTAAAVVAGLALAGGPAQAAPPQNDNFVDAAIFPADGATYIGTNVDATEEGSAEPFHAGEHAYHSVWYEWTPAASGPAVISTCNSEFNTRLGVYTGATLAGLTEVAANEDSAGPGCAGTLFAEAQFEAVAGTTYSIAVDTTGGYPDNSPGNDPRGEVRITVTPPAGDPGPDPEPEPDPDTTPATPVAEEPFTFRMPRFKPRCAQVKPTTDADCPDKATNVRFRSVTSVRNWVEAMTAEEGADILLIENPKSSEAVDGVVKKKLVAAGRGGQVVSQSIPVGKKVTTTASRPLRLKVGYFEPAIDAQLTAAALAALDKAAQDKPEAKSKCKWIATDASPSAIAAAMREVLGSGLMSEQQVAAVLKGQNCQYEVYEYFDAPGMKVDFVYDRGYRINKARDLVEIKVGLPVRQDFLLIVRDDPRKAGPDTLSIGTDGRLTVSEQNNVITVQVMERATGALIPNVDVRFLNAGGKPVVQKTDATGETTFDAGIRVADRYAIMAKVVKGGATMAGYRSIDAVTRTGSFVTLSGRSLTLTNGTWVGDDAAYALARSMPTVAASLGTGISATPTSAPPISQGWVAKPTTDGLAAAQHNGVLIPDDSNFVVAAEPGHVYLGGGLPATGSAAASGATEPQAKAWPNPFAAIGGFLNGIVTGLKRAFSQPKPPGTVAQQVPAAQQANVTKTAEVLTENGAAVPPDGPIAAEKLAVNSNSRGDIVSTYGGGIVPLEGFKVYDAQGRLIGQAGGNLIGQAGGNLIGQAGGNIVISMSGPNFTPGYGGKIISNDGAG